MLRVVRECLICQVNRPVYFKPPLHKPLKKALKPFLIVHCDLLYLPKTVDSERAVLLVVDSFTKWVEAAILPNAKAATVWKSF